MIRQSHRATLSTILDNTDGQRCNTVKDVSLSVNQRSYKQPGLVHQQTLLLKLGMTILTLECPPHSWLRLGPGHQSPARQLYACRG